MSEHEYFMSQLRTELHIAQPTHALVHPVANTDVSLQTMVVSLQERVTVLEKQITKLLSNANASTQTDINA
jgi:hypothetical protein